ncbi:uncharacterized protein EDB93DRAFT_1051174, partial [Suillus bovinus]|uniref:uncharacterized protein n=1 Tax=Suillus bovinus TaxID=48563 RepID=UPI001B87D9DC
SEYWVSHKCYHCKYCNIYIADGVPSTQHDEDGMRHKGNFDRIVRGLYKVHEKAVKDRDDSEEKREMERITEVHQFLLDLGNSHGTPAATPAPKKPPAKPTNPYTKYSTAASLG